MRERRRENHPTSRRGGFAGPATQEEASEKGGNMPEYRKKKDTDAWHWCKNCSKWPTSEYVKEWHSGTERPKTGELDNECKDKEEKKTCTT